MVKLTKILAALAITGFIAVGAGAKYKNQTVCAAGAAGLAIGGVGYVILREYNKSKNYKS